MTAKKKAAAKDERTPVNRGQVLRLLNEAIEAEGGVRSFAAKNKISPSYVSDVATGARPPGPKVLEPIGITFEKRTKTTLTYYLK